MDPRAEWEERWKMNREEGDIGSDDALEDHGIRGRTPPTEEQDKSSVCYVCDKPVLCLAQFTCYNCCVDQWVCKICSDATKACKYHPEDHVCTNCMVVCTACTESACKGCSGECITCGGIGHVGCISKCKSCMQPSHKKCMTRCEACRGLFCKGCCMEECQVCIGCAPKKA